MKIIKWISILVFIFLFNYIFFIKRTKPFLDEIYYSSLDANNYATQYIE